MLSKYKFFLWLSNSFWEKNIILENVTEKTKECYRKVMNVTEKST